MYCTKCGTKITDQARFCTACGSPVDPADPEAEGSTADPEAQGSTADPEAQGHTAAPGAAAYPVAADPEAQGHTADPEAEGRTADPEAEGSTADPEAEGHTAAPGAAAYPVAADAAEADAGAQEGRGSAANPATADPAVSAAPAGQTSFKAALDSSKQKSKRRIPIVVLVALVTVLLSSMAYAAYRVYTDFIAPQMQEQSANSQESGAQAEQEGQPSTVEASGTPQNVFQLAELLAMDPVELPSYLVSQGLVEENGGAEPVKHGSPANAYPPLVTGPNYNAFTTWEITPENEAALNAVDPDNVFFSSEAFPSLFSSETLPAGSKTRIAAGTSLTPFWHGSTYDRTWSTASSLESGERATSIVIQYPPLLELSEESVAAFTQACGLGDPLAYFTSSTVYEHAFSGNHTDRIQTCSTGFVTIGNERYAWYLFQDKSGEVGSLPTSLFGCVPAELAEQGVIDTTLYAQADWEAASDDNKALMFAQSIVQGRNIGNGGVYKNILTNEIMDIGYDEASQTYTSESIEQYEKRTGDTTIGESVSATMNSHSYQSSPGRIEQE